jgi:hypothetical protein
MIPTPTAQIQEAPTARDVTFPGFNGFPLAGTVLPGSGPWFAVLVADSGPLDRDWSDPRMPTHTGKAWAEWLQGQGVGSLRYDKRIAGTRDPGLNASLDAQSGDIRAALQAARQFPEAKGRKLLLVGHGEGALLSLLVGMEADALVLLAMPTKTMAKTIEDQLALQLPAERAPANLAYLRSVFQAIREAKPTPVPGPDIYTLVGKMGKALMAPETLRFVRDTLDLDPWVMASRIAIPLAAVWGDRDVVVTKPVLIPPGFKGTTLEIHGANHHFRHDPRTLAELDGATALEGYLDDKPLEDLTPLADWLKALR